MKRKPPTKKALPKPNGSYNPAVSWVVTTVAVIVIGASLANTLMVSPDIYRWINGGLHHLGYTPLLMSNSSSGKTAAEERCSGETCYLATDASTSTDPSAALEDQTEDTGSSNDEQESNLPPSSLRNLLVEQTASLRSNDRDWDEEEAASKAVGAHYLPPHHPRNPLLEVLLSKLFDSWVRKGQPPTPEQAVAMGLPAALSHKQDALLPETRAGRARTQVLLVHFKGSEGSTWMMDMLARQPGVCVPFNEPMYNPTLTMARPLTHEERFKAAPLKKKAQNILRLLVEPNTTSEEGWNSWTESVIDAMQGFKNDDELKWARDQVSGCQWDDTYLLAFKVRLHHAIDPQAAFDILKGKGVLLLRSARANIVKMALSDYRRRYEAKGQFMLKDALVNTTEGGEEARARLDKALSTMRAPTMLWDPWLFFQAVAWHEIEELRALHWGYEYATIAGRDAASRSPATSVFGGDEQRRSVQKWSRKARTMKTEEEAAGAMHSIQEEEMVLEREESIRAYSTGFLGNAKLEPAALANVYPVLYYEDLAQHPAAMIADIMRYGAAGGRLDDAIAASMLKRANSLESSGDQDPSLTSALKKATPPKLCLAIHNYADICTLIQQYMPHMLTYMDHLPCNSPCSASY